MMSYASILRQEFRFVIRELLDIQTENEFSLNSPYTLKLVAEKDIRVTELLNLFPYETDRFISAEGNDPMEAQQYEEFMHDLLEDLKEYIDIIKRNDHT